jgi:hypothetical protein
MAHCYDLYIPTTGISLIPGGTNKIPGGMGPVLLCAGSFLAERLCHGSASGWVSAQWSAIGETRAPVLICRRGVKSVFDGLACIVDEPGFDVGRDAVPVAPDIGGQFRLRTTDAAQIAFANRAGKRLYVAGGSNQSGKYS